MRASARAKTFLHSVARTQRGDLVCQMTGFHSAPGGAHLCSRGVSARVKACVHYRRSSDWVYGLLLWARAVIAWWQWHDSAPRVPEPRGENKWTRLFTVGPQPKPYRNQTDRDESDMRHGQKRVLPLSLCAPTGVWMQKRKWRQKEKRKRRKKSIIKGQNIFENRKDKNKKI